jgi:hypothetical protein
MDDAESEIQRYLAEEAPSWVQDYVTSLEDEVKELTRLNSHLVAIDKAPAHTSDGYHTFEELYAHRNALTAYLWTMLGALLVPGEPPEVWKTRRHHPDDPEMYEDYFLVGADLPTGTIGYHMPIEFWGLVHCPEIEHAPKYSGYSPDDVVTRIMALLNDHA